MELFNLEDFEVTFKPQTLKLGPFKVLWDRDKHPEKVNAIRDLSFVYFFTDVKSDFSDTIDEYDRASDVAKSLNYPKDWKLEEDVELQAAIEFYKERSKTVASTLLIDTRKSIYNLSQYIASIDFTAEDSKGKLKHDPKKFSSVVSELPRLLASLNELESQFVKELKESSAMRGNQIKNPFEDGEI